MNELDLGTAIAYTGIAAGAYVALRVGATVAARFFPRNPVWDKMYTDKISSYGAELYNEKTDEGIELMRKTYNSFLAKWIGNNAFGMFGAGAFTFRESRKDILEDIVEYDRRKREVKPSA